MLRRFPAIPLVLVALLAGCDTDSVDLSGGPQYVWVKKGAQAATPGNDTGEIATAGYAFASKVQGVKWGTHDTFLFTDSTMQDTIARVFEVELNNVGPDGVAPRPGTANLALAAVEGDSWRVASAMHPGATAAFMAAAQENAAQESAGEEIAASEESTDGSGIREVTSDSPLEEKLAAIDLGSSLVPEAVIAEYVAVLDRLEPKCKQPREEVGGFALTGVKLLKEDKGIEMPALKMLNLMDGAISPKALEGLGPMDCASIMALISVQL